MVDQPAAALRDGNPEVRVAAVDALSDPDLPEAVAPLMEALRAEKDEEVREDITFALEAMGIDPKTGKPEEWRPLRRYHVTFLR